MRTRSLLPLAVAVFLVALGAAESSPASALSCAIHPDLSPEAIASGSERLSTERAYPYEVGLTYFIPVQEVGPGGEPNYSFLCDPISEVDLAITDDLALLAHDRRVPFWTPAGSLGEPAAVAQVVDAPANPDDPDADDAGGSSLRPVAIGITAGLAVAVIVGLAATRARRRAL